MENVKILKIAFGPMMPKISSQLRKLKFDFDAEKVKGFEFQRKCLNHVQFADLIDDQTFEKAKQKLFNKIEKHVIAANNLKPIKK